MTLDSAQLQSTLHVLRIIYHRNKNQHRQGTWWKWLSALKRCVQKLIGALQEKDTNATQDRVVYVKKFLLPKCYVSFTRLVQDHQFSALGLALLAELAEIRSIILSHPTEAEEAEVTQMNIIAHETTSTQEVPEDLGEVVGRSAPPRATVLDLNRTVVETPSGPEAFGGREQLLLGSENAWLGTVDDTHNFDSRAVPEAKKRTSKSGALAPPQWSKKRKRKPANPIDDLFQGLG